MDFSRIQWKQSRNLWKCNIFALSCLLPLIPLSVDVINRLLDRASGLLLVMGYLSLLYLPPSTSFSGGLSLLPTNISMDVSYDLLSGGSCVAWSNSQPLPCVIFCVCLVLLYFSSNHFCHPFFQHWFSCCSFHIPFLSYPCSAVGFSLMWLLLLAHKQNRLHCFHKGVVSLMPFFFCSWDIRKSLGRILAVYVTLFTDVIK